MRKRIVAGSGHVREAASVGISIEQSKSRHASRLPPPTRRRGKKIPPPAASADHRAQHAQELISQSLVLFRSFLLRQESLREPREFRIAVLEFALHFGEALLATAE